MKSNEVFIITPIGKKGSTTFEKFDAIFKSMIEPAVKSIDENFEVTRADKVARPGSFVKDILDRLKNSYLVIANLTGMNPNVFYELGVRHTLSNRTIIITEDYSTIPSDLKEYRAIEYSADITGIEHFKSELIKTINEIIEDPNHPDNPVQDRLGNIIESKEALLENEILSLKQQLNSKKSPNYKRKGETIDRRIDRILKIWKSEKGSSLGEEWHTENDKGELVMFKIKMPEGDFDYYFPYIEELEETCIIISIHNDDFEIETDLADIRLMLSEYKHIPNFKLKFVIASQMELTSLEARVATFFKQAIKLSEVDNSGNRYTIELWDDARILEIEKSLGLK